eukprot:526727-Amphidinium_carterae.1
MAYLEQPQEEVETLLALLDPTDADQVYSPIATPEVQVVESDSSDSETPEVLAGLDVKATFLKMVNDWEVKDQVVTAAWWREDEMAEIYEVMASPWWKLVLQHSEVHTHSRAQSLDFDEAELMYLHTTSANFTQGCDGGNLGARFLFRSAGQAMLHRIIHHHF